MWGAPSSALSVSPTNFVVTPGTKSESDLLKTYPQTILITYLKGMAGFDTLSGDFSIESEGFIYEKTTFATHVSNNGLLSFFIN